MNSNQSIHLRFVVYSLNAYMIKQWNSRVRTRDEVVILGDFSVGKAEQTNEILNQLNGRLYMIKGNHDRYLKESEFNKERFVWIKPYAEMHSTVPLFYHKAFICAASLNPRQSICVFRLS